MTSYGAAIFAFKLVVGRERPTFLRLFVNQINVLHFDFINESARPILAVWLYLFRETVTLTTCVLLSECRLACDASPPICLEELRQSWANAFSEKDFPFKASKKWAELGMSGQPAIGVDKVRIISSDVVLEEIEVYFQSAAPPPKKKEREQLKENIFYKMLPFVFH